MQHFELKGQPRQVGNKATLKAFRKQGLVPCNLYGCGIENVLFTVDAKELKAVTNTPKALISFSETRSTPQFFTSFSSTRLLTSACTWISLL